METGSGTAVPDFGAVMGRERIIKLFRARRFGLTIACAGTGYGKSVLAAQLASADFDLVVWISVLEAEVSGDRLVSMAATAMVNLRESSKSPLAPTSQSMTADDAHLTIHHALRGSVHERICVVFDGCESIHTLAPIQSLALLLRDITSSDSAVVVTCRHAVVDAELGSGPNLLVVDENDLRFTIEDIASLAQLNGGLALEHECEQLMSRFGGHPALTSLMLQHAGLDNDADPPKGLLWYVDRLTDGLSDTALRLLYVASLLIIDDVHTLAACLNMTLDRRDWEQVKGLAPLFLVDRNARPSSEFKVHAVLAESARRAAARRMSSQESAALRSSVLEHLAGVGAFARIACIVESECDEDETAVWLSRLGQQLLRYTGNAMVTNCLRSLSPSRLAESPTLLLLLARALRESERFDDAREKSLVAWQLAEAASDSETALSAALLTARLELDLVSLDRAQQVLEQVKSMVSGACAGSEIWLAEAYMAVVEAQQGRMADAMPRVNRLVKATGWTMDLGSDDAVFIIGCIATVEGLGGGRWASVAQLAAGLARRRDLSPLQRIQLRANMASCYVELGQLSDAQALIDDVLVEAQQSGMSRLCGYAYGTRSCIRHACGEHELALDDYSRSEELHDAFGDQLARALERINAAVNMRALGSPQDALRLMEAAHLITEEPSFPFQLWRQAVRIETAASLVSLGDLWGGRSTALAARDCLEGSGADGQLLRVDLVLSEIDRLSGRAEAAIQRLAPHAEYIVTGSANWLCAMYVRAFPGLLGLLGCAVGADSLPLRMLLMLPIRTIERSFELVPDEIHSSDLQILRDRRGVSQEEARLVVADPAASPHPCHVRVFGGLEVTTPSGTVEEDDWRKRKARLLFLTLVLRQRQDIPRDVLLERLWPDMDEEHARRNFYVTWSTMKRALSCTDTPSEAKALVQCSGGVCRITRLVRSDLDDFDDALSALRSAASKNDVAGVKEAATRLTVIYRGELLPGDLYEEWFAEVRERAKHDFCDAMVTAATVVSAAGLSDDALMFLRKASAADPWREDVYQSMMRCQMGSGQRSRAIETYLMCRSRLTEDLGIDPSVETTRLYQAVLAMDATPDEVDLQNV